MSPGPSAVIEVSNPSTWTAIATRGSIGAGESYMQGWWKADDLTKVVQILVLNKQVLDGMDSRIVGLVMPVWRLLHRLRRNDVRGSQKNIAAHYDLGNDFFQLFLDPTLMYSSGIFLSKESSLEEASIEKLDRICRKLALGPTDHVVEIGTGWGGFAIHAATKYGGRITTTTISQRQFALASERIQAAGLQDKVTVLLSDYRKLEGSFDKLVSIEMIEAVGNNFLEDYFQTCSRLLKPDGSGVIQAIVIADQQFNSALRNVDFIQKYIFPGSCLPSLTRMAEAMTRATDLRIHDVEDITPHYAETLRHWRQNMFRNISAIRGLGLSDDFIRMWEFYLCYSEGGFRERVIGDVQMMITKPDFRGVGA